jgi:hypothetical protein
MIGLEMAGLCDCEPLEAALAEWRAGRPLAAKAQVHSSWQDPEIAELVMVAEALWQGAGQPRPGFTVELERMVRLGAGPRPQTGAAAEPPHRRLLTSTRLGEAVVACGMAAGLAVAAVLVTGPSGSPGAVPTARAATGTATPTALVAAETPASDPG